MEREIECSIYCDLKTLNALKKIAKKNNRKIIDQIRHWIEGEGK